MYRYSWEMNKNVISILYLKYICIVQVQLGDEPECENHIVHEGHIYCTGTAGG